MNNHDTGLRYKGLQEERMEEKYKRPSTSSKPQNKFSDKKPLIHPFKQDIEKQNIMNPKKITLREENIILPKMSVFSLKKQVLIKNIMKEMKFL